MRVLFCTLLLLPAVAWGQYDSSMVAQWEALMQTSACLTGGQYCREGKCGNEGCAFNKHPKWKAFLALPKEQTAPYLISVISDTTTTRVHTCPFKQAKKGEVAVYVLQFLHQLNWYELDKEYHPYTEVELTGFDTSLQAFLWQIIEDSESAKKMAAQWQEVYDQSSSPKN